MVRGRKTKIASLVYVVALITLYLLPFSASSVAIGGDTPTDSFSSVLLHHVLFHHFHASFLHLFCNIWAFLTIIFFYSPSPYRLLAAFVLSSTFPAELLHSSPIIGLSAFIYTLIGSYALTHSSVSGRIRFNVYIIFFILLGIAFPSVCVTIHLYAYALGVGVALINYPFFKTSKQ